MYALNLGQDGRILSATIEQFAGPGQPLVDVLPEGDIADYRYQDGQYVYDPLPKPEPPPETPDIYDELAAAYSEGVQSA